jgi:hypothetical protein
MTQPGFDPLGFNEAAPFESAEERVDGALRDNKSGTILEPAKHFQTVEASGPERGEGG